MAKLVHTMALSRLRRHLSTKRGGFAFDEYWAEMISDKINTIEKGLVQATRKIENATFVSLGAAGFAAFIAMIPQVQNTNITVEPGSGGDGSGSGGSGSGRGGSGGGGGGGTVVQQLDHRALDRRLHELREELEASFWRTIDGKIKQAFQAQTGSEVAKHAAALYAKGVGEAEKKLDVAVKEKEAQTKHTKERAEHETQQQAARRQDELNTRNETAKKQLAHAKKMKEAEHERAEQVR